MIVEFINPDTGERCTSVIEDIQRPDLEQLTAEYATEKQIYDYIQDLPYSAEAKSVLYSLARATIKVGEAIVHVGKKILEFAIMLAGKYRHATFAVIVASIMILLISMIPLIGPLLSSILGPLMIAFGLAVGIWEDLKRDDPKFAAVITETGEIFKPLAREKTV